MKLQEKFEPYCDDECVGKLDNAENCVDVAEDFAMGFAKWLNDNNYFDALILDESVIKELLEIYKKENGL